MAQALWGRTKEMGVCVYGKVISWPDTFGTCPETNPHTFKAKRSQKKVFLFRAVVLSNFSRHKIPFLEILIQQTRDRAQGDSCFLKRYCM